MRYMRRIRDSRKTDSNDILPTTSDIHKNRRLYFDWLGIQLDYKQLDDWYNLKSVDVHKYGGKTMLNRRYNGSVTRALKAAYPEHNWLPWRFKCSPKTYWQQTENQKRFLGWLMDQLGYKDMDDWYKVTADIICKHGGGRMLTLYKGSPSQALQAVYPEHNWLLWRFNCKQMNYWKVDNQKVFFDWLGNQLGFKDLDDWYRVTPEDISKYGGGGLLNGYFNDSPSKALQTIYPAGNWMMWRFSCLPKGYWESVLLDQSEQKRIIRWLSDKLHITSLDNWHSVSLQRVQQLVSLQGLKGTLTLAQMVQTTYPEHHWDMERLRTASRKKSTRELIPGSSVAAKYSGYCSTIALKKNDVHQNDVVCAVKWTNPLGKARRP